ncbi:MAG: hypothetical protein CMJ62_09610, partial [Planctomycetaceae bacterium]|nr:hypothetical protein [Planctomycetaceae bacterium]
MWLDDPLSNCSDYNEYYLAQVARRPAELRILSNETEGKISSHGKGRQRTACMLGGANRCGWLLFDFLPTL